MSRYRESEWFIKKLKRVSHPATSASLAGEAE